MQNFFIIMTHEITQQKKCLQRRVAFENLRINTIQDKYRKLDSKIAYSHDKRWNGSLIAIIK